MSCKKCEEAQDDADRLGIAYYRWKNANVGMVGCTEHLVEIFDTLSRAQAKAPVPEKPKGIEEAMDEQRAAHIARHKELHRCLDELFADYIDHHPDKSGYLGTTIGEFIVWSSKQTADPDERKP